MKKAEVTQAEATRDLRYKRWNRFKLLRENEKGVPESVVEEEERDYKSAEAAVTAAAA